MNTFGNIFRLTTFGESHGACVGGVIDGMPAGVRIDLDEIARAMVRRRPGQSALTTARREADEVEILSGVFEGVSTGTPLAFIIRNTDARSADYGEMKNALRPSHADYTYLLKYGLRDYRGGGRASARETAARVAAGAIAMQCLRPLGVTVNAFTRQVGTISLQGDYTEIDLNATENNPVRCPDEAVAAEMEKLIAEVRREGDTVGGIVECVVRNCPVGLGEPLAGKFHARLASAMMSIPAAKGFDYGMGFGFASKRGSEVADKFVRKADGTTGTSTNYSGGVQGGITNGEDIYFRVAFKPAPTLLRDVETLDTEGYPTVLHARGRHDPCVVPRAVPVVEAMAALTLIDCLLENKTVRL